jgi:hypothetical protein
MKKQNKILRETVIKDMDMETGEILNTSSKQMYLSKKFDNGMGYLWRNRGCGVKTFFDVPYPKEMSMIDRGRMATLAKYIWHDTNMLGYRGHGRIKPYDVKSIGEIVNLKEGQAESFIKRMIKLGIIKRIEVPFGDYLEIQFYINPIYYFAGPRLSGNLYVLFHQELDKYLPDWVKAEFTKAEVKQKAN